MAQPNITLNQEEIQALLLDEPGEAFKKILEASLNKILQSESAKQLKAEPHWRSEERSGSRNGSRERALNTRVGTITLRVPRHKNVPSYLILFLSLSILCAVLKQSSDMSHFKECRNSCCPALPPVSGSACGCLTASKQMQSPGL